MSTYDNWKAREPDSEPWGECDYCHRCLPMTCLYLLKLNVWGCSECCDAIEAKEGPTNEETN